MHPRSKHSFHVHVVSGSEVCVRLEKTRRWKEMRVHECARWRVCIRRGKIKPAIASRKTSHSPKVTYQQWAHASEFKAKTEIYCASGSTNPWESPSWKIWKSRMSERRAGDSQSLRLWGVESMGATSLGGVDGGWSNVWWHRNIITHLLHIDWPHTGDYHHSCPIICAIALSV